MVDHLRSEVDKNVEHIVSIVSKNCSALLADQNLFKALTAVRKQIWDLLAQVDARFEEALRTELQSEEPNVSAAMGIDTAPAVTVAEGTSAEGRGSAVGLEIPSATHVGAEASVTRAPDEVEPKRDVKNASLVENAVQA